MKTISRREQGQPSPSDPVGEATEMFIAGLPLIPYVIDYLTGHGIMWTISRHGSGAFKLHALHHGDPGAFYAVERLANSLTALGDALNGPLAYASREQP